jgi:DNA polymerase-3 subunit gamma/tau
LLEHVRWVAIDAGLDVSDAAIDQVLTRGGGSARDTLSALELVASTGGEGAETVALEEFVESMIDNDPGRALTSLALAVANGEDPRTITELLIGQLRNGFLALMAPELVQLPSARVDAIAEQARRLGAPGLVRGIEQLGEALVDMRHAPDPRVVLDVALVRLTAASASTDLGDLVARIDRLEHRVGESPDQPPSPLAQTPAAPVDPATGRATLGGRARREPTAAPPVADDPHPAAEVSADPQGGGDVAPPAPADAPATPPTMTRAMWEESARPALRGMARAVYAPATFVAATPTTVTLAVPNDVHRGKCEQHRPAVEKELSILLRGPITLDLQVGDGAPAESPRLRSGDDAGAAEAGPTGGGAAEDNDDDIDIDDLVDAPPESVKTPIDRLAEAFPGSELIDERGGSATG